MKCIYLRTNLVNGKQYVGQANNFEQREYDWMHDNVYTGGIIDKARKKYGLENFKVEILRECDTQNELNIWERYYINKYDTKTPNGYNLTDGGNGVSGFKHSKESIEMAVKNWKKSYNPLHHSMKREEVRKKVSEALKKRYSNKENHPKYGTHLKDEVKERISNKLKGEKHWLYGKHHSEETRKKMSETHNREDVKKRNILNQPSRKEIYQYSLDGILVKSYISAAEAAREVGTTSYSIIRCCNGGYFDNTRNKWHSANKCKGYKWSYKPL